MTILTFGLNTTNNVQSDIRDGYIRDAHRAGVYGEVRTVYDSTYDGVKQLTLKINGLLQFMDLSAVPKYATLISATVHVASSTITPGSTITLRKVLTPWVESEVTWQKPSNEIPSWVTWGAMSDGNDRSATISATHVLAGASGTYQNITSAQITQDFSDLIKGVSTWYGYLFEGIDNSGIINNFHTKSGADGLRPYLTLEFDDTVPGISVIPDPLVDGSTGNSITTVNFAPSITSLIIRDSSSVWSEAVLSLAGGGGSNTFNMRDVAAYTTPTAGIPFDSFGFGRSRAIASNGTQSYTHILTGGGRVAKAGWKVVDFTPPFNMSVGSLFQGATRMQSSVSAVSVAAASQLTVTGHTFSSGDVVTLLGFTTTPSINGQQTITVVDADTVSIPVNVTAVTDGTGTMVIGAPGKHGQFYFDTSKIDVSPDGTYYIQTANPGAFNVQVFDVLSGQWQQIAMSGDGIGQVAPVASNGTLSTAYQTAGAGTLSATDANSDPLVFSIVGQGTKGVAVITNSATGAYTYTPNAGQSGADAFTFNVSDGTASSNTATVSVTIGAAPIVSTPRDRLSLYSPLNAGLN